MAATCLASLIDPGANLRIVEPEQYLPLGHVVAYRQRQSGSKAVCQRAVSSLP
jgi:hypothetical protein